MYALICKPDLEDNKQRMPTPFDVNLPIETIFNQIDESVEFSAAGRNTFTNVQVVDMAYILVLKIGMFPDETKVWRRRMRNLKTRDVFKATFTKTHADLH